MKYKSDLTDDEWNEIQPLFTGMRHRKWSKRTLVNAVRYFIKTGCQWRQLPNDFPPYQTVYSFFKRACESGLWDKILQHLVRRTRERAKRQPQPSYGIIDSQSVKTVFSGNEHGIDGGKKIKGRKRHIVVDVMGNLLWVFVHAANIHDTVAGIVPAHGACLRYPRIEAFCGDRGYRKTFEEDVKLILNRHIDISEKIKPHGWKLLPKRWVVERTFSWFNGSRRLSKDYEILSRTSENIVKISHICVLLKRLFL